MSEEKVGRLGYNTENDRFGVLVEDLWENDGLHCGEILEIWYNEGWFFDRIEKFGEWYLVFSGLKGDKLEGVKVRIND